MKKLLIALALALTACPIPGPEPPPTPPPPADGAGCPEACENQSQLGCELAEPTPEGATCEQVCSNTMDGPGALRWDVECLAAAISCAQCG